MFGIAQMGTWTNRIQRLIPLIAILVVCLPLTAMASSDVPAAVISNVSTLTATGLTTNEASVALDACGDIYTIASDGGQVFETPSGGGTATTVLAAGGPNYDPNALWIDAAKANLYVTEGPYNQYRIPIANCVPQLSSQTSISIGNLGAVSYYYNASAIASDSSGNVFIATNAACCADPNELLEENSSDATGTTLLTGLAAPITSLTVDSNNNIYYVAGGAVYELPYSGGSYAATPQAFGSGFTSATGVSLDSAGNLYVTDNGGSKIYEIPNEGSGSSAALNPSDQFVVAAGVSISSAVAADAAGNLYFTNNGTSLYELTRGSAALGSLSVGSQGTVNLSVVFNADETPAFAAAPSNGAFSIVNGGSCVSGTSQAAGSSCSVSVQFAPKVPGLTVGALVVSGSGGTIGMANLSGLGSGAGLTIDPGTITSIGSGYSSPGTVTVDSSGNLFAADSKANSVWEIAAGGSSAVVVGSGLSLPSGVAVDGAGDLYIADSGNNRIVMVPVVSGALTTADQTVVVANGASIAGMALSNPKGLTIDSQGNLYIADTGNNRVVFLPGASAANLAGAAIVGSGWSSPLATTVTASGLIYVADSGDGDVYSLPYPTAAKTLVATGFNNPSALATDAAGDLFVVDQGNSQVVRIPNISGSLAVNGAFGVSTGIASPYGIAIDPDGNLYVTDAANAALYSINRTSLSQSFGIWDPNTTSGVLTYFIESAGNQSLTLNSPYYTVTGNTADFSQSASVSNSCASGALAVGMDCGLGVTFTPPADGTFSETLTFSSNATNGTVQQAAFQGTGGTVATTSTTLSITSPTGNPYFSEAITLSAAVTSAAATPVGSVALQVDGTQKAIAALNNGVATFTLSAGLVGGIHTVQALYKGGATSSIAFEQSSSAPQTITVTKIPTSTTVAVATLYSNPPSQPGCPNSGPCSGVTLTATVTPADPGLPTGTVNFTITQSDGTTVTQSEPVSATSGGGFQASYIYDPPVPASGSSYYTVAVQAAYTGDANFAGSSSATSTPFYVSPAAGSLTVTPSGTSLTASAGGSATVSFTPVSYGGWTGLVGFSCDASSLPKNTRCVFSPGQTEILPGVSNLPVTMSVVIDQPPQTPTASGLFWWLAGPAGLLLFFYRRQLTQRPGRAIMTIVSVVLLGIAATGLGACGGSAANVTPAGSSTVTVRVSSAPFVSAPSSSSSTPATQACPANNPANAPCSQQTFQIALKVQ